MASIFENQQGASTIDRQGIDMMASLTGGAALFAGLMQVIGFRPAQVMMGIGNDVAGQILAVQWIIFGLFLLFGGLMRARQLIIFGGEFLLVASVCGVIVLTVVAAGWVAVGTQAILAAMALASTGFARLTDKADLKRQLVIAREQARFAAGSAATSDQRTNDDQ